MARSHGPVVLILVAAGLAAALALPSAAQGGSVADLDPAGCSNGTFVARPSDNPGLAADCRALVAVHNHWIRHSEDAELPDHPFLTWGRVGTQDITSWKGISVVGQRVTRVSLGNSGLSGTIPPEISQLTNLTQLDLHSNQLTGSIPPEIGELTNLKSLYLSRNELTGSIPPEIGELTNLTVLGLHSNQLTGSIPPEIGELTNLKSLFLSGNELTGYIPPQILKQLGYSFDAGLGLVANVEETRKISLGNKLWEVWICNTNGPLDLDLNSVTGLLNQTVTPYFEWLSDGRFTPQFSATGTITVPRSELAQPELEDWTKRLVACETKMLNSDTHNNLNKAVIVENRPHAGGVASNNIIVGGASVTALGDDSGYTPRFSTVAHEIGHKLGWPHSYNSHIFHDGVLLEGDNSTDIMSGGSNEDLATGTPAINRYTAGWIDPKDVAVYSGEPATYELSPIGTDGTQMLVVPSGKGQGTFYSLSPLTAQGYNRGQPTEGVEVYLIDQSLSFCDLEAGTGRRPCYRIQPHPPPSDRNRCLRPPRTRNRRHIPTGRDNSAGAATAGKPIHNSNRNRMRRILPRKILRRRKQRPYRQHRSHRRMGNNTRMPNKRILP